MFYNILLIYFINIFIFIVNTIYNFSIYNFPVSEGTIIITINILFCFSCLWKIEITSKGKYFNKPKI